MDGEGLLETARVVRPYLWGLVGSAADRLDQRIAELLAADSRGEDVTADLRSLLSEYGAISTFAVQVLRDAPHYRPPRMQPSESRGDPQHLPGGVGPVLHAGKYACPHGDYVWYRPAVGTPIRRCPTHGSDLARY